jgi:hypothetical protein
MAHTQIDPGGSPTHFVHPPVRQLSRNHLSKRNLILWPELAFPVLQGCLLADERDHILTVSCRRESFVPCEIGRPGESEDWAARKGLTARRQMGYGMIVLHAPSFLDYLFCWSRPHLLPE